MGKLIQHAKRVFRKFWFLIVFLGAIQIFFGLGAFIVLLIISMMFFDNFPEEKKPEDFFTEEEWRKIHSDEASQDDEEYLSLLARFQTFECPVKVDEITTWTSSELTKESFICHYEINDKRGKYGEIDLEKVKKNILDSIDKEGNKVQRIIATNRNMIFSYYNVQTETVDDIVLSIDDLKI